MKLPPCHMQCVTYCTYDWDCRVAEELRTVNEWMVLICLSLRCMYIHCWLTSLLPSYSIPLSSPFIQYLPLSSPHTVSPSLLPSYNISLSSPFIQYLPLFSLHTISPSLLPSYNISLSSPFIQYLPLLSLHITSPSLIPSYNIPLSSPFIQYLPLSSLHTVSPSLIPSYNISPLPPPPTQRRRRSSHIRTRWRIWSSTVSWQTTTARTLTRSTSPLARWCTLLRNTTQVRGQSSQYCVYYS